jgi:hypothetical protein
MLNNQITWLVLISKALGIHLQLTWAKDIADYIFIYKLPKTIAIAEAAYVSLP